MKTDLVKGFNDLTGKEAEKRAFIKEIIRRTFEKYNFEQVETPVVEYEEFVKGENNQDQAISDIFKLKDKGKRNLALRYEFTFQLKRIAKNKKLPYRRFQIGPVFRDEPTQGNRLRQFTQCDIDIVGSTIKDEAEILSSVKDILDSLKINFVIYVNNRKLLNEILDELKIKKKEEVIREVDKLDKLPEKEVRENLKKYNAEKFLNIIKNKEDFFKKYKAYEEIEELKKYCGYYGVKVVFCASLARGLAYYTGNVFEIKSNIKESLGGGGSYLVNGVQSTGIALGLDRLELVTNVLLDIEKFLVVSLNEDKKAINLAKQLRAQGKNVNIYYGKPSKALEYANSYGIKKVIFVGAQEIKKKRFKVKDMKTGAEKILVLEKRIKKNLIVQRRG
ncbi:histidine--tRNA ligase [Candidatus Pacearchaeota archaeon]|nr:histidine--tRNA ligase [Candidatus Pacearchaeota archaeon]